MSVISEPWDYLIVTASGARQAESYEHHLTLRRQLGQLAGIENVLVVADPDGKRVGSGGSTIFCLMEMLNRRLAGGGGDPADPGAWLEVLRGLRVLIVHAGGDSRRLVAYGPCGKIFVPLPGETDSALGTTLFDRQLPTYLKLPPMPKGAGQIVVAAGDVLLSFNPQEIDFAGEGVTGLGYLARCEQASKHGVFCVAAGGQVRLFLQKPTVEQQAELGAANRYGQALLDVGLMNLDAATAVRLLELCGAAPDGDGRLGWTGRIARTVQSRGLDLYREICCAIGSEASVRHLIASSKAGGPGWPDALLDEIFQALCGTRFSVQVLPHCGFLHFGTTGQIISSGIGLLGQDRGVTQAESCLGINNDIAESGELSGQNAWVEGCRIARPVHVTGWNVLVGVDVVDEPLRLSGGQCLDVLRGVDRGGENVWFVRNYGVGDTFKDAIDEGATFCGVPLGDWLAAVGAEPDDVWDADLSPRERTLWNARVFPAESSAAGYRRWLWTFQPSAGTEAQHRAWIAADRYSAAEIADTADQQAFHERRDRIRSEQARRQLRQMFRQESGFSAAELAYTLSKAADPAAWVVELLAEARWCFGGDEDAARLESFTFCRMIHSLGSAVAKLAREEDAALETILPGLGDSLRPALREWLDSQGIGIGPGTTAADWAERAKACAFRRSGKAIISSAGSVDPPVCAIRSDEIVWGRVPVRLDLGGGWSDTPPYTLEHGGCVINAAVELNGQPPVHAYARVIDEPVIRIGSIDLGKRIEITGLDELLDFRSPTSEFSLAKAVLAISGFSPESASWPGGTDLAAMLEGFGGGIELTTLAAIPKGSGLGTSSVVGAVLLAAVQRMMGRTLTQRELFHGVLRLEQALTTGGGWQDQIGGAVDGVKVITTAPGLIPDARIHYVPADVLDPRANDGATLLYYTGITRLAKNILQQVIGRYLDRDRAAMATLRQIHALPSHVAEAMARKAPAAFGELLDVAWRLNKQLDPNSSTPEIEALLDRVRPHLHGAKLLGAGGGGFLLMVCKSSTDAGAVREMLRADPPNDKARFFDFGISRQGLVVTVC